MGFVSPVGTALGSMGWLCQAYLTFGQTLKLMIHGATFWAMLLSTGNQVRHTTDLKYPNVLPILNGKVPKQHCSKKKLPHNLEAEYHEPLGQLLYISTVITYRMAQHHVLIYSSDRLFPIVLFLVFNFVSVSPQCESHGELLVSLSYQSVTHRLNVVVLKAKHLPTLDITGLSGSKYTPHIHKYIDIQMIPFIFKWCQNLDKF